MNSSQQISDLISEEELNSLQTSGPMKYVNFIIFPMLWILGISLNMYSLNFSFSSSPWVKFSLLFLGSSIIGIALNAFFLILHEGCHSVISKNHHVNRWLSVLYTLPYFISFNAYRTIHLTHHKYLGSENDPDNYNNFSGNPKLVLLLQLLRLTCAALIYLFMIPILSWNRQNKNEKREMIEEYFVFIVLYLLLFYFVPFSVMLVCVLIPLIPLNFLINIRGLTQHTVTNSQNPLLASRSVRCHPIVTFLYMNENYHLEHHLFPSIPCDRLGDLKKILENRWEGALTAPSYSWFLMKFFSALIRMDNTTIGIIEKNKGNYS